VANVCSCIDLLDGQPAQIVREGLIIPGKAPTRAGVSSSERRVVSTYGPGSQHRRSAGSMGSLRFGVENHSDDEATRDPPEAPTQGQSRRGVESKECPCSVNSFLEKVSTG